ncbi:retrovirus-related pol polyprotein from transposon TNT 1-94 [Tanacetum coccineum]
MSKTTERQEPKSLCRSEICLGVDLEPDEWIKDSGFSKHMMGNRKLFSTYKAYNGGNVEHVDNLRFNLLSIGQICDNKCRVTFSEHDSEITKDGKVIGCTIVSIRTDHGREFDNEVQFGEFCNANGITHNSSAPRTPQSNGVVERKNRTLQEMSRTMLNEQSLPQKLWCNVVDTSTYILNRILIRAILGKTPYELLRGYSQNSKAYIILNKHNRKIKESLNVTFDETPPPSKTSPLVDDDLDEKEAIKVTKKKNLENVDEDETLEIDEIVNIKESRNHPQENVIGNLNQRKLRSQAQNQIAILESIRILLAYAYALDFKLFQMDVKSEFLNGLINEEVYVVQPPGFIDSKKPDHVYKLKKALYGLKQAPKAWYDRLKAFLIKHEYKIGMVDNTLFTKKKSSNIVIVQIYVDDILFGSTCQDMCDEFAKIMHDEFEMSMMGELNSFLGLQIIQMEDGTTHLRLWYPKGTGIETVIYAYSDYAGDYVDRKSTSDICTFVGCCLTSWFSKKQTALVISTIEDEYVSARKVCQQALWMKQVLIDYDVRLDDVPIMCDNKGAIDLSKNPVQHSRTKRIEIHYHFLRDNVQKGHISIKKVVSVDNVIDILTKPLKRESFNYLRLGLGMMEHIS